MLKSTIKFSLYTTKNVNGEIQKEIYGGKSSYKDHTREFNLLVDILFEKINSRVKLLTKKKISSFLRTDLHSLNVGYLSDLSLEVTKSEVFSW